jgi:hypothetical protein
MLVRVVFCCLARVCERETVIQRRGKRERRDRQRFYPYMVDPPPAD